MIKSEAVYVLKQLKILTKLFPYSHQCLKLLGEWLNSLKNLNLVLVLAWVVFWRQTCKCNRIRGGVVGTQAAKMAAGLGADVTIFDISLEG